MGKKEVSRAVKMIWTKQNWKHMVSKIVECKTKQIILRGTFITLNAYSKKKKNQNQEPKLPP